MEISEADYQRLLHRSRLMDLAQDILIVLDRLGNVEDVNEAAVRMHGGVLADYIGRDCSEFLHPESAVAMSKAAIEMYSKRRDGSDTMRLKAYREDGSDVHLELHVSWSQAVQKFYVVERDVTEHVLRTAELEDVSARLHKLSITDTLTDLPNRLAFDHTMYETEQHDAEASLAFIDVNKFKSINDQLGHVAGDSLLRIIADRLRAVKTHDEFIARIGGDEFGFITPQTNPSALQRRCDEIRRALNVEAIVAGTRITVACAVGMTVREPGETATSWMRRSDQEMYQAKAAMRSLSDAA